MGSSDFYENVSRYQSSAAHAVVSPKVHETEAGQVTTTMVVSFFPPFGQEKLTAQEEAPEPIRNVFEDADAPPEEKTIEVGPANDIPMLDTTALPPNPNEPEQPSEIEDLRAPVGKDAGAPQVTAEEEIQGWHGDAEDDGKVVDAPGDAEPVGAPVGARVEEVVDIEMDAEQQRLVDAALRADEA
jgi:dolichyl-phosphate-mannose-protein mannosyltransferase